MKAKSLMLLRVSVGVLIIFWGVDKIINVEHAIGVSNHFYLGLFSSALLLNAFGVFETVLGIAVVVGWKRKLFYPALIVINAVSALSCWNSIIDPWGWFLQGTMALLQPTALILFACLVLHAFQAEDTLAVDHH